MVIEMDIWLLILCILGCILLALVIVIIVHDLWFYIRHK